MGYGLSYMRGMKNVVVTLLIVLFAAPAFALELVSPVVCTIGQNCWVQQYFDHDATAAATDYACGVASYDGHDGTDIRVLNTSVNVDVVAAAAGVVKGVRDGVPDRLVKTEADKTLVDKIECGNGVVLDHGDGWETQYCHLRQGSVKVKAGDKVEVGGLLGTIGYSGNAAFPHVHLSVRKDGTKIDPFSVDATADCKAEDRSLWNAQVQKALAHQGTQVLQLAWAPKIYDDVEVEAGAFSEFEPGSWASLVVFAEVINLYKDDTMILTVSIPGQEPIVNTAVMKRNRAVQRLFAGKKVQNKLPLGIFKGLLEIKRGDAVVVSREITFGMKD